MTKFFLSILLSLLSLYLSKAEHCVGYYINNGDTAFVTFDIPMSINQIPKFVKIQKGIKYYDSTNNLKIIDANLSSEVYFKYSDKEVKLISVNFTGNSKTFIRVIEEGKVNLYSYTIKEVRTEAILLGYATTPTETEIIYYFQKPGKKMAAVNKTDFRNTISEYFYDCHLLVQKIQDKELKHYDVLTIAHIYNNNCME